MEQRDQAPESQMPDPFDRALGAIHDLPDVVKTKMATIPVIPKFGVGGATVFLVQTVRQIETGDTIFLQVVHGNERAIRLVIPAKVANTIARQRDALTTKLRSKLSKAAADERKLKGIKPGFMKGKHGNQEAG